MSNKLVVAAAGSGKTTLLIEEALKFPGKNICILTYTEENEREIRRKVCRRCGTIPPNLSIQTWFSFLLRHGVRPYQSYVSEPDIRGINLVNMRSGLRYRNRFGQPVYWKEEEAAERFYFDSDRRIFTDKISKFVFRCNQKSGGAVLNRLAQIYEHIFVDEVQDLAGYDLELIRLFFESDINILLVGDPRQVTYLTHHEQKHSKYKDGLIKNFLIENVKKGIAFEVDETSLSRSHRNNGAICDFSSSIYPDFPKTVPCDCHDCETLRKGFAHEGIHYISQQEATNYLQRLNAVQLRYNAGTAVSDHHPVFNFGQSKGLAFDHCLIHPTGKMEKWLCDPAEELKPSVRAKFYVAVSRARASVAFVCTEKTLKALNGAEKKAA